MDIKKFLQVQEAALKKYRRTYKLLDFLTIFILFYTLLIVLSVDQALPLIRSLELRLGTAYSLAGISISFASVVLLGVSALVALVLTLIIHVRDKRINTIEMVEDKYPGLRERLRTAYDNLELDNIVANDLRQAVSSAVEKVSSSVFLRKKRINFGLIVMIASVILLAVVTLSGIHMDMTPDDWKDLIDDLPFSPDDTNGDELVEIDDDSQQNATENLTGESAVIVVEGTEVDLSLPPGSGVGFNEGNETEQDTDFEASSSYEIDAISSETYYESFPPGYETVIKSYFEQMAEQ